MKSRWICLFTALCFVILQGCQSNEPAPEPSPVVIDDNVDGPAIKTHPDKIVLAQIEIGLGGGAGDERVAGSVSQGIDIGGFGGGSYNWTDFIGLGDQDVSISGEGVLAPYACPDPAWNVDGLCTACPNTLDPATGLPLSPDPCAGNGRGTFAAGAITATLQVTNNTANMGSCDGVGTVNPLFNASLTTCAINDDLGVAVNPEDTGCRPNNGPSATAHGYCKGDLVYNGSGAVSGFCLDGATPCDEATAGPTGLSAACGAGTCATYNGGGDLCETDFECGGIVGDCVGAAPIGNPADFTTQPGSCWTGCGSCVPGRDLNCVAIRYLEGGEQAQGTPTDLDALGNVKCSGAPYQATVAGIDGAENVGDPGCPGVGAGTDCVWFVDQGAPGLDQGATSAPETISIDATNDSYCVHQIQVLEDPRGNYPAPECRPQCGDWVVADQNGEVCEPVADYWIPTLDYGCTQGFCSNSGFPCNAGPAFDPLAECGDPTAVCGAVCDPVTCAACTPPIIECGNGVFDFGLEDCDPTAPGNDFCCNANCTFTNGPSADCPDLGVDCLTDVCNGAGACGTVNAIDGSGCGDPTSDACNGADTCFGGACQANFVAAGTACSAEPTCDPDQCDGAGGCTDNPLAIDGTLCPDDGVVSPGDTCCGGSCSVGNPVPGSCLSSTIVNTVVARTGTSTDGTAGNYNNDVDGNPGANQVFAIFPNNAAAAPYNQDMVVFDITLSQPLGGVETVNCLFGATPVSNNCATGMAACAGWGVHPGVTGGGIDTVSQQSIAAGNAGIGTAVAPDEADTMTPMSITCNVDGLGPVTQNIEVGLGFVGATDQVLTGGVDTVATIQPASYCSNGATEWCTGTVAAAPFSTDRGLNQIWLHIFYDTGVFDLGMTGQTGQPHGGNPYHQPTNGSAYDVGAGTVTVTDQPVECTNFAAGVIRCQADTVNSRGGILKVGGTFDLSASVAPAAGTMSVVEFAAIDATGGTAYITDSAGLPIRGVDSGDASQRPSTNVTSTIIWQ